MSTEERHTRASSGLAGLAAGLCVLALIGSPVGSTSVHPADLAFVVAGVVGAWLLYRDRRIGTQHGVVLAALAPVFLVCCSLAKSARPVGALADAAQMAEFLVVCPLLIAMFSRTEGKTIHGALALGVVLNVVQGLVQYAGTGPAEGVTGLLTNRTLYGVVIAGGLPFVVGSLPRGTAKAVASGVLVFVCMLTILSLPALVLFGVVALLSTLLLTGRRERLAVTGACLVAVVAISLGWTPRDNRAVLAQSLAVRDANGEVRRWAVEAIAATRAIADAPLLGHGPGAYQETVGLGVYRQALPHPDEKRAEPGTQIGVLVLAVESGIPAAVLLAALFAMTAYRTGRKLDERRVAGVAMCALFGGTLLTPVWQQGTGLFPGVVLGLAGAARPPIHRWFRFTRVFWKQALLLCVATVAALGANHMLRTHGAGVSRDMKPGAVSIVLEAESPLDIGKPGVPVNLADAACGRALAIHESSLESTPAPVRTVYEFGLDADASVVFWLRAKWNDGCGNSMAVAVDGGPSLLVGNDGTYRAWHWVRGPKFDLSEGRHRLELVPTEDGLALDQMLLTSDAGFYPSGTMPGAVNADPRSAPDEPAAPSAPIPDDTGRNEAGNPRADAIPALSDGRFVAAVAGSYRSGFEGALLRLGVPCQRLNPPAYLDADTLARYDLVCLSDPRGAPQALYDACRSYIERGGTLIIEDLSFGGAHRSDRMPLPAALVPALSFHMDHCVLQTDESRFFRRESERAIRLAPDIAASHVPLTIDLPGADLFGTLTRFGYPMGAAIVRMPFGMGRVYYNPLPIGFSSMWRGASLDNILREQMLDAIGGRWTPSYVELGLDYDATEASIQFADDFMRNDSVGDAWQVASGEFAVTGDDAQRSPAAFALECRKPGVAAAGNPDWRDHRVSASVQSDAAAGVWLTAESGGRIALVANREQRCVLLRRTTPDGNVDELARADIPLRKGWHRLSLLSDNGAWVGFVDSRRVISHTPDSPARAAGRFGVVAEGPGALFDDVSVRPTADLVPGSDRALGEDGSPYARPGLGVASIEMRNVNSPLWLVPAAPGHDRGVRTRLPLFAPGSLAVDGQMIADIAPDSDGATIPLPDDVVPKHSVLLSSPGLRDYAFAGRITEWYSDDASWDAIQRWACDRNWRWPGAQARGTATLWYGTPLSPPYCINALLAVNERRHYDSARTQGRDLNLVVAGNGRDLSAGYTFRVMEGHNRGCELWHGDERVAQVRGKGLPTGHMLHHVWFEVRAVVEPHRLRCYFDDELVIEHALDLPPGAGHVGVWTENNAINVTRITLSVADLPADSHAASK